MKQKSSKASAWLSRNADFETSLSADRAEFTALRFGTTNIEEGLRNQKRVGSVVDGANPNEPRWIALESAAEEFTGRIAEELDRRAKILGSVYPFKISGNTLTYTDRGDAAYEFCLAATMTEDLKTKPFNELPVQFERLCRHVSKILFGPFAQSVRTGWPRDKADGMPTRAREMFAKIESMTGEWVWSPDPDLPLDPEPKHFKEMGLDLLTWIPMPDGRVGHAFFLGQCACGKTDWFDKRHEPDIAILQRWFKPLTVVRQPWKCLYVPFHISNTSHLRDVSTTCITFDRGRIALIARSDKNLLAQPGLANLTKLTKLVVDSQPATR